MTDDTHVRDTSVTRNGITEWTYICERCGEQMVENKCKILCRNCGYSRDCSDP